MNDELKQKMVEYLEQLESGLKTAADFSAEQAPLVVQEYLNWMFLNSLAGGVCCGLAALVLSFAATKVVQHMLSENDTEGACIGGFVLGAFAVFASAGSIGQLLFAAKVCIAPRVVILEKISELLR